MKEETVPAKEPMDINPSPFKYKKQFCIKLSFFLTIWIFNLCIRAMPMRTNQGTKTMNFARLGVYVQLTWSYKYKAMTKLSCGQVVFL